MKVRAEQLDAQLKRQQEALPVYLVTGDEPLLCGESVDAVRAHLRRLGFSEREVMHVDSGFSWDSLLESANALSLFAERKLIELRLGSQKLNRSASDLLQRYLANPAPDNALLIICDRLDRSSKQSAWFKTIEQVGLAVEVWPVEPEQLPQWLGQRAASQGVELDNDALQLLADRIEGNLLAARQELDKLALLYPGQRIGAEEVIQAVSDSSRFDIFALTDAALLGQAPRCQHILQVLRQEGNEAAVVLWALTRDIRMLHAVSRGIASGQSYDTLCQRERIWGKRKQLVRNACRRFDSGLLEQLLQQAAEVDLAIKGQRPDDPWLLLSQITLALAGCAQPWRTLH
jgi:DNA polymerase-3 subunit delta